MTTLDPTMPARSAAQLHDIVDSNPIHSESGGSQYSPIHRNTVQHHP
jgi:hypothetical protein